MLIKNLIKVMATLPLLALSTVASASPINFGDKWLREISMEYENGQITPETAKHLLLFRLNEVSKSGRINLTSDDLKKLQVFLDDLESGDLIMVDDGSVTGK